MPYSALEPRPVTRVKVSAGANGEFEYELLFGVTTAFTAKPRAPTAHTVVLPEPLASWFDAAYSCGSVPLANAPMMPTDELSVKVDGSTCTGQATIRAQTGKREPAPRESGERAPAAST